MSEFLIVGGSMVRPLPANMGLHTTALAEPLDVALHGINVADGIEGKHVMISGSRPIDLLTVVVAVAKGAAGVISTGILVGPLDRARWLGARSARADGTGCADMDASDGTGDAGTVSGIELLCGHFDITLECSGIPAAVPTTMETVRPADIHAQIEIMGAGPQPIALATLVAREIQLHGCSRFNTEIDEAIELLATRPGITDVVAIHTFKDDSVDLAVGAFATAKDSNVSGKVSMDMQD